MQTDCLVLEGTVTTQGLRLRMAFGTELAELKLCN